MSAPRPQQAFEWIDVGDVVVIHFTVNVLRDERIIRNVFDECDRLIAAGRPRLVIDFTGMTAFASYAIGKLISLNARATQAGGRLVLCELTPVINEIVDIMNLRRRFSITKTEREALESFV